MLRRIESASGDHIFDDRHPTTGTSSTHDELLPSLLAEPTPGCRREMLTEIRSHPADVTLSPILAPRSVTSFIGAPGRADSSSCRSRRHPEGCRARRPKIEKATSHWPLQSTTLSTRHPPDPPTLEREARASRALSRPPYRAPRASRETWHECRSRLPRSDMLARAAASGLESRAGWSQLRELWSTYEPECARPDAVASCGPPPHR